MTSTNDQAVLVAEEMINAPEGTFYCGLCRGWVGNADYARHGHPQKEGGE